MPPKARGGRGGGGGRGRGRGPSGTQRIAGQDVRVDDDIKLNDRPQPTPFYPEHQALPTFHTLNASERNAVQKYLALREKIHNGPYYTYLGENWKVGKTGARSSVTVVSQQQQQQKREKRAIGNAVGFDPFEGMETYGQRYVRRPRRLPRVEGRGYILDFFPPELHSTLNPSLSRLPGGTTNGTTTNGIDSKTNPNRTLTSRLEALEAADDESNARDVRLQEDNNNNNNNNRDEDGDIVLDPEDAEAALNEADVDDDYEDDEDDLADDYNAEQYFDDGGEDGGDDYGGDEGDGGGGGDYD
ncbi:hypothetical protein MMC25_001282 [Agyrium rufum]|nr:hypothetical protein [Agyrium rufum]